MTVLQLVDEVRTMTDAEQWLIVAAVALPRRGGQGVGPTPVDGHRGVDGEVRRRRAAGSRAGVSGLENLSSDFYDHLAFSAPLFDVGQGIRGRLEWKYPVYNGTYDTGIDEGAELA
jgi:hypothetical protein